MVESNLTSSKRDRMNYTVTFNMQCRAELVKRYRVLPYTAYEIMGMNIPELQEIVHRLKNKTDNIVNLKSNFNKFEFFRSLSNIGVEIIPRCIGVHYAMLRNGKIHTGIIALTDKKDLYFKCEEAIYSMLIPMKEDGVDESKLLKLGIAYLKLFI